MVRDNKTLEQPTERDRDASRAPARARRRSFAGVDLDIGSPQATREVIARADADFERIFGSD
jgi:hypothetical protein